MYQNNLSQQLPEMELPIFKGDSVEWDNFISTFDILVHNTKMTDVQKMIYLRQSLSERALDSIMQFHSQDYQLAYVHLRDRYGRDTVLVERLMMQLDKNRIHGRSIFVIVVSHSAVTRRSFHASLFIRSFHKFNSFT